MALRLLEHYTSTQGEGPRVGKLTQFVRFAGCNLKCPSWPCDTPFAIDPKLFNSEQKIHTSQSLAKAIADEEQKTGARNICFTGGEPLIQPQGELAILVERLTTYGIYAPEIFTNGTRDVSNDLIDYCNFVVDWKLEGSGEDPFNDVRIANLKKFQRPATSIKFTIASQADLALAHTLWQEHLQRDVFDIFVGPVWEEMSAQRIVEYIKENKLPWRLNTQVHNYIYGAQVRGT